jgi:hypothetical protein
VVQNKLKNMELGNQLGPESRHICSSIHTKRRELEGYSHPHFAPHRIPMGNHRMEHHQYRVNTTTITINNHMAIIQVQIGKNTIEDVLLDGGYGVNIIT